jgi:hypothetical protein
MDCDSFAEEVLRKVEPGRKFEPQVHYDPDGDCIEFFATDEPFFAERIDSLVTVYYGRESREVIGALIKGIRKFVKEIVAAVPGFKIELEDGPTRLEYLFTAKLWHSREAPKGSVIVTYKKLREVAERADAKTDLSLVAG